MSSVSSTENGFGDSNPPSCDPFALKRLASEDFGSESELFDPRLSGDDDISASYSRCSFRIS